MHFCAGRLRRAVKKYSCILNYFKFSIDCKRIIIKFNPKENELEHNRR